MSAKGTHVLLSSVCLAYASSRMVITSARGGALLNLRLSILTVNFCGFDKTHFSSDIFPARAAQQASASFLEAASTSSLISAKRDGPNLLGSDCLILFRYGLLHLPLQLLNLRFGYNVSGFKPSRDIQSINS